jgi:GAF domain-containing protein
VSQDPFVVICHPGRLDALRRYALLDRPAAPALDRLTRLAARMLKVPMAFVTLVKPDRQFYAGAYGLAEPAATTRWVPLSHSFCQHVVASAGPLIINDARQHPLVCNNPAIPELGVIAYAGMPLTTSDG